MTIAQAEGLKRDLTDKYVVVQEGVPELRRFSGLTGQVKTVNMNGRALVQFDGPVDISWYDIDPSYLKIVAAPQPKAKHEAKPAAKGAAAEAPQKPAAGKSPLELARAQGATKAAPAPAAEGKKLSPLELARQQGAGGKASAAPTEGKKLSPLELARQQGAVGKAPAAPAPVAAPPVPQPEPVPAPAPASAAPSKPELSRPGSTAEIIALARQQGPFRG